MPCNVLTLHARVEGQPREVPSPSVICAAAQILSTASHGVLATTSLDGRPYAVPVTLALIEGDLYFHCAKRDGRRTKNLRENNRVSLSVIHHAKVMPKAFNVDYKSLLVEGRATEVTDDEKKRRYLKAFCLYHDATISPESLDAYFSRFFDQVALWRISTEHVSVKETNP